MRETGSSLIITILCLTMLANTNGEEWPFPLCFGGYDSGYKNKNIWEKEEGVDWSSRGGLYYRAKI